MAKEWFNKAHNLSDQMERKAFYYNKSIELCPEFIDPYIDLTANQHENGNYDDVIEVGNKGLKVDPFEPRLHYNMAISYRELEQYDDAIRHLGRASELFESNRWKERTILKLMEIYSLQDNYADQFAVVKKIITEAQSKWAPYIYNAYAWILAVCPDINKEKESLDFARKAHESLADKWFVKGTLARLRLRPTSM